MTCKRDKTNKQGTRSTEYNLRTSNWTTTYVQITTKGILWKLMRYGGNKSWRRSTEHYVQTRWPKNTWVEQTETTTGRSWMIVPHRASQNLGEKAPRHMNLCFWRHCVWRYNINHFNPDRRRVKEREKEKEEVDTSVSNDNIRFDSIVE